MKAAWSLLPILVTASAVGGPAAEPRPRLLAIPTPAAIVVPAPETILLHAVSDDARWLLITASSDRLGADDRNGAADVFVLDRTTGTATLISTDADGHSGNGTSLAGGMSADGSRVVFQTRASNLISNDGNRTWDALIRDLTTGTNGLANLAVGGTNSTGPATEPRLSADGRYVVFISPAQDLAPGAAFPVVNLYRRDLLDGRTEAVTTELPPSLGRPLRLASSAMTPDGQGVALDLDVQIGSAARREIAWRNLAAEVTTHCSRQPPPELVGNGTLHNAAAGSADGRWVAFRSQLGLGATLTRHGLSLHDLATGATTLLSLRTNDAGRQTFPATAYHAQLSADGRLVVYSAPWPYDPSQPAGAARTNGPSQVYVYDAETRATRLVSAAPDGITPADADAGDARVTPDGRGVVFTSQATNLVTEATTASQRVYWWERGTGPTRVAAELGADSPAGRFVLSPDGEWIVSASTDAEGIPTVSYFHTTDSAVSNLRLPPVVELSATGRGWIGVQPAGVSADGRYVALTAFPPEPAHGTNHMQVYLHDTQTGARQLVTEGVDGRLANSHPAPPSLSADASRLLFVSAATNLVADDTNGVSDVFVHTVASGQRWAVRGGTLPPRAPAVSESLISPDGGYAFVRFVENNKAVARLAHVGTGAMSAAFPGLVHGWPCFSQSGHRLAVSWGVNSAGGDARIEVHDPAAWVADGANPAPALWDSPPPAREPRLSADGARVAYLHIASTGTNAVVVVEWADGQLKFAQPLDQQVPSDLDLSGDGRFVVWVSRTPSEATTQVWRGDVASGTVALVSVATDGASEGNGNSKSAAISADGRYIGFASLADNLVADDTNGVKDVFLRDLQTGQTLLVSRTPAGRPGGGWSLEPFFSADGRSLFFLSHAPDLAPGDYNEATDLFQVEVLGDSPLLVVIQRNLATGQAQLLWNGQPGRSYGVEFQDDLGAPWTRVPGTFAGNAPVEVNPSSGARRFFRVVELP